MVIWFILWTAIRSLHQWNLPVQFSFDKGFINTEWESFHSHILFSDGCGSLYSRKTFWTHRGIGCVRYHENIFFAWIFYKFDGFLNLFNNFFRLKIWKVYMQEFFSFASIHLTLSIFKSFISIEFRQNFKMLIVILSSI